MTFNPPPGWPIAAGFEPTADWTPDPTWPPAPPGWQFFVANPTPAPQTAEHEPTAIHPRYLTAPTTGKPAANPPPAPSQPTPAPARPQQLRETIEKRIEEALQASQAGDVPKARAALQQAEKWARQQVTNQPASPQPQQLLAKVLELTSALELDDDLRRAATTAEEAVRIRLALVNDQPHNADYLLSLGVTYNNLGTVALAHCLASESVRWLQVSCQVFRDALTLQPNWGEVHQRLGVGAYRLGAVAAADDKHEMARAAFEESVAARRHPSNAPGSHQEWHELGESLTGLLEAQNELRRDDLAKQTAKEAVTAFRNAVDDQDVQSQRNLALALVKSAGCAWNDNDAEASARQLLEAARIWLQHGTESSGRRWPVVAEMLRKAASALQDRDALLADACRRAAKDIE